MIYKALSDMSKPTTFTVKHYDKTIIIEIDHSDIDLNEVMETFEALTIAMGFSKDGFRDWVKEMGDVYTEEDEEELYKPNQALKDAAEKYLNLRHNGDNFEDYQNKNN
jgi:hypothetical protein